MELEDQKKIESRLNSIIRWEGRIIQAQIDYMCSKNTFEYEIKQDYRHIALLKRTSLLKQQGLKWSAAPLMTSGVIRKVKKNCKDGKISPLKKKSENTTNKSACCRKASTMKIGNQ